MGVHPATIENILWVKAGFESLVHGHERGRKWLEYFGLLNFVWVIAAAKYGDMPASQFDVMAYRCDIFIAIQPALCAAPIQQP